MTPETQAANSPTDSASRFALSLTIFSSVVLVTSLYWLILHITLVEAVAIPRYLSIGKDLQNVSDPQVYLKICKGFLENLDGFERSNREALGTVRTVSSFLILCSGIMFLLSLRLLRLNLLARPTGQPARSLGRAFDWILDALGGKLRLWVAFWGLHVLPMLALQTILAQGLPKSAALIDPTSPLHLYFSLLTGSGLVAYLFGLIAVWRCAKNTQYRVLTHLARILIAGESIYYATTTTISLWSFARMILPFYLNL